MTSPRLLPESPDERDTAKFLRRFSELISVGQSASYLRHAAGLIEELVARVQQAEDMAAHHQTLGASHQALQQSADLELRAARADIDALTLSCAEQARRLALAETDNAGEHGRMRERAERAEAKLAEASELMQKLRWKVASLGITHVAVPIAKLELLRGQFELLAREFDGAGGMVARVMCEIGVRGIDQELDGMSQEA